jgi:Flp pilus assembly protein TadG
MEAARTPSRSANGGNSRRARRRAPCSRLVASRQSRRGSATLEFALVLPILLSVVLLCVDYGQLAYYYIGVTNAARAGAAYGSTNIYSSGTVTTWQNNVIQAVRDEFYNNGWYDSSKLTVDTPTRTAADSSHWYVTVTVHYTFHPYINWGSWFHTSDPRDVTLTRTVVMPWHI